MLVVSRILNSFDMLGMSRILISFFFFFLVVSRILISFASVGCVWDLVSCAVASSGLNLD